MFGFFCFPQKKKSIQNKGDLNSLFENVYPNKMSGTKKRGKSHITSERKE